MIYKITYAQKTGELKKIRIDFDNIIHKPQNVLLKETMKECRGCRYNSICLKMNISEEEPEENKVAKQLLNENIQECIYYSQIQNNASVYLVDFKREFTSHLAEEIKKRNNALQGIELN